MRRRLAAVTATLVITSLTIPTQTAARDISREPRAVARGPNTLQHGTTAQQSQSRLEEPQPAARYSAPLENPYPEAAPSPTATERPPEPPAPIEAAEAQPAPNPQPSPPAQPGVEQWRTLVAVYFPADQVETALRIIGCESGGDPNAENRRSGAAGLFQQIPRYWPERTVAAGWPGASIFDPEANVAVSANLWAAGTGASHWNASRNCWAD